MSFCPCHKAQRVETDLSGHRAITETIHVEVLKINPHLQSIQFHNIIQAMKPNQDPEMVLAKVQSLTKRGQHAGWRSRDLKTLLESLGTWISSEKSALFLVNVAFRADGKAKEFAIDVIKFLRDMSCGVCWSLSVPSVSTSQRQPALLVDLLKNLVFQVLVQNPSALNDFPTELDAAKFLSIHTEAEWCSLLSKLLLRIPKSFLVIEAQDVFLLHRENSEWPGKFFQMFQTLVNDAESSGKILKILILGYGSRASSLKGPSHSNNRIVSSIQQPIAATPRMRKLCGTSRQKTNSWRQLRARY